MKAKPHLQLEQLRRSAPGLFAAFAIAKPSRQHVAIIPGARKLMPMAFISKRTTLAQTPWLGRARGALTVNADTVSGTA
jgi:hypothetical protein